MKNINIKCYCDSSQEMIELMDSLREHNLINNYDYIYDNNDISITHSFNFDNTRFNMKAFGIYSQTNMPKTIKSYIDDAFKPDIFFCDEDDNLIISMEKTSTAPVGNAINQRLHRLFYAVKNNIPFKYILPNTGFDQSQNMERKNTGVLPIIAESFNGFNPVFFYDSKNSGDEYKEILNIIKSNKEINYSLDIKKINESEKPNWSKSDKTIPKNKAFYTKIKDLFQSGKTLYKGAPFSIINIDDTDIPGIPSGEYGIICVPGYKKNGAYADPNCGDIATFSSFLKEFTNIKNIIVYLFEDRSNLDKDKFLKQNNKLLKMCKLYTDYVVLHDESVILNNEINIKISNQNSENKIGEDTVTIILALPATLENEYKLNYIQCPSGSWTYNAVDNNVKRDDIRPDIIITKDDKIISISSKNDIKDLNKKETDRKYKTDYLIYAVSSKSVGQVELLDNEALIILDLQAGSELNYSTNNKELENIIIDLYKDKFNISKI
jgi:hypothetical protein